MNLEDFQLISLVGALLFLAFVNWKLFKELGASQELILDLELKLLDKKNQLFDLNKKPWRNRPSVRKDKIICEAIEDILRESGKAMKLKNICKQVNEGRERKSTNVSIRTTLARELKYGDYKIERVGYGYYRYKGGE